MHNVDFNPPIVMIRDPWPTGVLAVTNVNHVENRLGGLQSLDEGRFIMLVIALLIQDSPHYKKSVTFVPERRIKNHKCACLLFWPRFCLPLHPLNNLYNWEQIPQKISIICQPNERFFEMRCFTAWVIPNSQTLAARFQKVLKSNTAAIWKTCAELMGWGNAVKWEYIKVPAMKRNTLRSLQ